MVTFRIFHSGDEVGFCEDGNAFVNTAAASETGELYD